MSNWTEKDSANEEQKNIINMMNLNDDIEPKKIVNKIINHDYKVVVPDILYNRAPKKKKNKKKKNT